MSEVIINSKIIESLGLSSNESKVFHALLKFTMGRNVSQIARNVGLPRTTVAYTLNNLKKRNLAEKGLIEKRYRWKYRRGLEFMQRKPVDLDVLNGRDSWLKTEPDPDQ